MGQMKCKWISDDFSEICTNVDCDYLADFCPCTEFPAVCRHSELVGEDRKEISGGCVYAVEYEDGIVKIGCTANVPRRMYELRHVARGVEHIISKVYVSKCVSNVRKYERDVLHGFAPVLTGRKEFFRIPFESAVNKIKQFCGEECEAYATSIEDILKDEFIRDAVAPDIALQYYKNNRK